MALTYHFPALNELTFSVGLMFYAQRTVKQYQDAKMCQILSVCFQVLQSMESTTSMQRRTSVGLRWQVRQLAGSLVVSIFQQLYVASSSVSMAVDVTRDVS